MLDRRGRCELPCSSGRILNASLTNALMAYRTIAVRPASLGQTNVSQASIFYAVFDAAVAALDAEITDVNRHRIHTAIAKAIIP